MKKFEWSKIVCGLIIVYGVANGVLYNVAVFMDKCPDSALAVQSVTTIIGGYMSYLLYQFGLKNSRNKFGIDDEGVPYSQRVSDLYGDDEFNQYESPSN
jgi:hypothetical protein